MPSGVIVRDALSCGVHVHPSKSWWDGYWASWMYVRETHVNARPGEEVEEDTLRSRIPVASGHLSGCNDGGEDRDRSPACIRFCE